MNFAPSIMNMSLLNLENDIRLIDPYASFYHVDILDWHYVKNLGLSPLIIKNIRSITQKPIEAHLYMTYIDSDLINYCLDCGTNIITMPADVIGRSVYRFSKLIHNRKGKFGVFLNPSQPLSTIKTYAHLVDQLIILSVDPGFSGQDFIPETYHKIKQAQIYKKANNFTYNITIDGCCHEGNFQELKDAGADTVVLGRGLFQSKNTLLGSIQHISGMIRSLA